MKKRYGFTLTEILTAVVIVTILVAMAVPLYEKTVERSRMAEARTLLAKLQDAKLYAMDNMGCKNYSEAANCPTLKHLNIAFVSTSLEGDRSFETDAFHFSIFPGRAGQELESEDPWWKNAVCARRTGGDYAGTVFLYASPEIVGEYVAGKTKPFLCMGANCQAYGQEDVSASFEITCN